MYIANVQRKNLPISKEMCLEGKSGARNREEMCPKFSRPCPPYSLLSQTTASLSWHPERGGEGRPRMTGRADCVTPTFKTSRGPPPQGAPFWPVSCSLHSSSEGKGFGSQHFLSPGLCSLRL